MKVAITTRNNNKPKIAILVWPPMLVLWLMVSKKDNSFWFRPWIMYQCVCFYVRAHSQTYGASSTKWLYFFITDTAPQRAIHLTSKHPFELKHGILFSKKKKQGELIFLVPRYGGWVIRATCSPMARTTIQKVEMGFLSWKRILRFRLLCYPHFLLHFRIHGGST